MEETLRNRTLKAVLALGECSVNQVLRAVGRYVSAATAAAAGRRKRKEARKAGEKETPPRRQRSLEVLGRRQCVLHALRSLAQSGEIRRMRRGVYAPPLPRIYTSTSA